VNTNRLVRFYSGVDGLKTGFTSSAGYCLTATAKRDNMRLITVVMGEDDTDKRSADTTKMLDYGFNIYMVRNIIDEETIIDNVSVELGEELTVDVISKETITILNKKSDSIRNITYDADIKKIVAPVKKGDEIGIINIIEDGKVISKVVATVKNDVDKANILTVYLRNLREILKASLVF
jgi:D-alanyl-D-alanine carboxypeptidase (penicillin-binding protein 5/6)